MWAHIKFKGHVYATSIQKVYRGHRGRKRAIERRKEVAAIKEKGKRELAAARIQGLYRMKKAKKRVKRLKQVVLKQNLLLSDVLIFDELTGDFHYFVFL